MLNQVRVISEERQYFTSRQSPRRVCILNLEGRISRRKKVGLGVFDLLVPMLFMGDGNVTKQKMCVGSGPTTWDLDLLEK